MKNVILAYYNQLVPRCKYFTYRRVFGNIDRGCYLRSRRVGIYNLQSSRCVNIYVFTVIFNYVTFLNSLNLIVGIGAVRSCRCLHHFRRCIYFLVYNSIIYSDSSYSPDIVVQLSVILQQCKQIFFRSHLKKLAALSIGCIFSCNIDRICILIPPYGMTHILRNKPKRSKGSAVYHLRGYVDIPYLTVYNYLVLPKNHFYFIIFILNNHFRNIFVPVNPGTEFFKYTP